MARLDGKQLSVPEMHQEAKVSKQGGDGEAKSQDRKVRQGMKMRLKPLVPVFDVPISLAAARGVTLLSESVTPVTFFSAFAMDGHCSAFFSK